MSRQEKSPGLVEIAEEQQEKAHTFEPAAAQQHGFDAHKPRLLDSKAAISQAALVGLVSSTTSQLLHTHAKLDHDPTYCGASALRKLRALIVTIDPKHIVQEVLAVCGIAGLVELGVNAFIKDPSQLVVSLVRGVRAPSVVL